MTVLYSRHPSPLGELLLVGERGAGGPTRLRGVYLPDDRHGRVVDPTWVEDREAFATIAGELSSYFRGELATFDLPLDIRGTPFQRRVWAQLELIPFGTTVSYAEVARRIGKPGAARAVGAAVGRNPLSIVVPCHRVVGRDGALTGYAGSLDRKSWLLQHERGLVDRSAGAAPAAVSGEAGASGATTTQASPTATPRDAGTPPAFLGNRCEP